MMLLDGCFIVELFAKHLQDWDDPIYRDRGLLSTVCADMLLLENQLPYCILQCIFSCVFPDEHADVKLVKEAVGFCSSLLWLPLSGHPREVESYHHLLHLIHCRCLPITLKPDIEWRCLTIPSAEKLEESGIKFKRKARKDSVLDIEFNKHGVMEIPYLFIGDFTICLFRNFVAFEQCYPSAGSCFTVFIDFMDAIINTKADVEILRQKDILEHAFDRDEKLALPFHGLTKGNLIDAHDYYLSALFNNVKKYCNSKRHGWRASLMRDYFGNPWSIIALIGATVVVILTAVQSFFPVYAYVRPPHQS